jgi:hypothetical protein
MMTRPRACLPLCLVGAAVALAGCSSASSGGSAANPPGSPPGATAPAASLTPASTTRQPIDNRPLLPGHLADAKLGVRRATPDTVIQPHDRGTTDLDASNTVGKSGQVLVAVVCFRGALTVHVDAALLSSNCTGHLQVLFHTPADGQGVAVVAHAHERQGRPWALGLYSGS